ncbi:coiled-coil domain-containing protein 102B [Tachyglossus aculeatus]|uniref:coiled-coil domain-containing protein 102B n=1 Tax=Tachyglossus aculeatus TaxID=9261 RepID=UPI0018F534D3|nr:coiled-coil domain-containing protein 102B [Tachyglossus aculeatus]
MNLDSIRRLIEETQVFQIPPSSSRSPCESAPPVPAPDSWGHFYLPQPGFCPHSSHCFPAHGRPGNDWDIGEELRLRELEEVKARAAQMEKTMRWWSDCTANWREKWSKVRAERNKAREEGKQLRMKLEMTMKELSALKQRKQDLGDEREDPGVGETWKKKSVVLEDSYSHGATLQIGCQEDDPVRHDVGGNWAQVAPETRKKEVNVTGTLHRFHLRDVRIQLERAEFLRKGASAICATKPGKDTGDGGQLLENELTQISALKLHLDESQKTLRKEREVRLSLEKEVELLESDLSLWKWKYQELKESHEKSTKQFNVLHGLHQNEVGRISEAREDMADSQTSKDRTICKLREEVERLQTENTTGWDQREMLQLEKQGLERENRRLKAQVREMEEHLGGRNTSSSSGQSPDITALESELPEPSQELVELQYAYYKLNKKYQDEMAELIHANNRVDQREADVKKLRVRVEELKKGLSQTEDELDDSLNQVRKLQRSLDEQIELNDNLQIQVTHLQNRLGQQKVTSVFEIKSSEKFASEDSTEAECEEEEEGEFYH